MTREHKEDHWDRIPPEDRKSVLKYANVGRGLILKTDPEWDLSAGKKLFDLTIDNFEDPVYPMDTGDYHVTAYESEVEFNFRRYGLHEINANAGISGTFKGVSGGVSGSTSSSTETDDSHDSKKKTYYLYAEYLQEKVTLNVKDDLPDINPAFEAELKKQLEKSHKGVQKLIAIYKVLNDYGWYMPISMMFGGKLTQTETVESDSTTDKHSIEKDFKADLKANVGMPGVFEAEGGGGVHDKTKVQSTSKHYTSTSATVRHVVGGSGAGLVESGLSTWISSLDDALLWQIVGIKLRPTLSFVSDDILNEIRVIQAAFGSYENARKECPYDNARYFVEVETDAESGLGEVDWG